MYDIMFILIFPVLCDALIVRGLAIQKVFVKANWPLLVVLEPDTPVQNVPWIPNVSITGNHILLTPKNTIGGKWKRESKNFKSLKTYHIFSTKPLSPKLNTNPPVSKFWKTSPRQTTKLQTDSSTFVINDIVADTINSPKVNINPASEGKATEAQQLENDAEMNTSSASEDDILEYNMSELGETSEESSEEICTPSRPRPRKYLTPTKYKKK
ncbi:hypothetical protein AVEN_185933-1 [Araneus ventricosus]|uniref:Uncharacterized protein n=1 Tax=Araneus ventricosus TaxID=182803 RepID=A0A4Y2JFP8_ARAVE|nr:hypothetical protein AVEN_185933-1 [Araneus ventricosus]